MLPVGFEPTISVGERPQTYALERAATETGTFYEHETLIIFSTLHYNWYLLQDLVSERYVHS